MMPHHEHHQLEKGAYIDPSNCKERLLGNVTSSESFQNRRASPIKNLGAYLDVQFHKRPLVSIPTKEVIRIYGSTVENQDSYCVGEHAESEDLTEILEVNFATPVQSNYYKQADLSMEQDKYRTREQKNEDDSCEQSRGMDTKYRFWPVLAAKEPMNMNKKQNLVAIIRRTPNKPPIKPEIGLGGVKLENPHSSTNEFPCVEGKLKVTPKQMRIAKDKVRFNSTANQPRYHTPIATMFDNKKVIERATASFEETSVLTETNEKENSKLIKDEYARNRGFRELNHLVTKPLCILGVAKKVRKPKMKQNSFLKTLIPGPTMNIERKFSKLDDIDFEPRRWEQSKEQLLDLACNNQAREPLVRTSHEAQAHESSTSPSKHDQTGNQALPEQQDSRKQDEQAGSGLRATEQPSLPKKVRPTSEAPRKPATKSRYAPTKKPQEIPTHKIGWFKVKFPKLDLERLEEIGRGGFGVVYRGIDQKSGKEVAIKYFDKRSLKDSMKRKSLQKEVDALYNCDHPNVIRLVRVAETESCLNFVFDFWGQTNLCEFLKKRTLQLKEVKSIIKQIIDAISYLHQRGIYHRDLKCENIMIRKAPRISPESGGSIWEACLIDFGLAAIDQNRLRRSLFGREENEVCEESSEDEQSKRLGLRDGDICGTRYSMSPEMLKADQPYYCGPNDVWGIGVLFYFLLTNGYPFGVAGSFFTHLRITRHIALEYHVSNLQSSSHIRSTAFDISENFPNRSHFANNSRRISHRLLLAQQCAIVWS
jgi:tRNA A-37 threonylcarbamoyl transferase component Bud32